MTRDELRKLCRAGAVMLSRVPNPASVLARAYVEERRLIFVQNEALRQAADQADAGAVAALHGLLAASGARLSFDLIQRLLETQRTRTDRKGKGAVYTPLHVVDAITRRVLSLSTEMGGDPDSSDWRALDPAVGAGAFLLVMADALLKRTDAKPSEIVAQRLYGNDVSPESVEAATLTLNLWALDRGDDAKRIETNIRVGDALDGAPLHGAFGTTPFDAVVGNPPYVRIQNLDPASRSHIREKWRTAKSGNIDLYIPFIEAALSEISETGVVGFVTPTSFTTTYAGRALRELLMRKGAIRELYDFDWRQVFDGVSTYACLLFLTARRNEDFRYAKATTADTIPEHPDYGRVRYARLRARKWELVTDEAYPTIRALETAGRPLGRFARISVGLATLADKVYLLSGERDDSGALVKVCEGKTYLIEEGVTARIVKASVVKSEEEIASTERRILFPYRLVDGKRRIYGDAALRSNFPNAYAYLRAAKPRLDARDRGKPNPTAWYAYGRSQGIDSGFERKLLTSGLNLSSRFLMCDDPEITFYSGYGVQTDAEDLRALQKILNSPLMDFYIHHTSRSYQHGYKSYAKSFLTRFSVPYLTDADRAKIRADTNPEELVAFLLGKYEIDLADHPDLSAFLDQSPKMRAPLPAYDVETPAAINARAEGLW